MLKTLEHIDYSNPENKHKMNKILIELLDSSKEYDKGMYDYAKCEIYEAAYGKNISEEMAQKWVECMNPKALWTKDQTDAVKSQYGVSINSNDFYVLMNMAYSDYNQVLGDPNENLEKYIDFAKDFVNDQDAKEDKLYNYYKYIVKGY